VQRANAVLKRGSPLFERKKLANPVARTLVIGPFFIIQPNPSTNKHPLRNIANVDNTYGALDITQENTVNASSENKSNCNS